MADAFPAHVNVEWLGHSNNIADKHYRQTTVEHFARAIQPSQDVERLADGSEKAQQKAQQGRSSENTEDRQKEIHRKIDVSRGLRLIEMGDTGFEPVTSAV